MQRLGENAMWLREDNRSEQNEIVLPYDSDLALWDRPSWIDSLLRLRWCCPSSTSSSPSSSSTEATEATTREQVSAHQQQKALQRSDRYNNSRQAYHHQHHHPDKLAKPKKSKKKKKKQHAQAHNNSHHNTNDYIRAHPYISDYDAPPPPPPPLSLNTSSKNIYDAQSQRHGFYPQSKQQPTSSYAQQQSEVYDLQQPSHEFFLQQKQPKQQQYSDQELLDSFKNNPPQPSPSPFPLEHFTMSSLSGSESDNNLVPTPSSAAAAAPPAPIETLVEEPLLLEEDQDQPSKPAAAAAAAAAATLKKQGGLLSQPARSSNSSSSNNNNIGHHRPPLIHRGVTPTQHAQQQDAAAAMPSPTSGIKPPLPLNGRSRSLSPSSKRPSSPGVNMQPVSPNNTGMLVRPRLHSESSRRSMGTASSRHRRKAHESFEFSTNSLQKIVHHSSNNKDNEELSRTPPPAYIECPTHHGVGDWDWSKQPHNKLGDNDDDNSWMNLSVDEEISQLISRIPTTSQQQQQQPPGGGYISPVDSSDTTTDLLALRSRDANLPALSWMNSWAAQGDAAAGNPAGARHHNQPDGNNNKSVRIKDVPLPPTRPPPPQQAPPPPPPTSFPRINVNVERPVFLPRCRAFDKPIRKAKQRVVISGWAAISLSDQLRNRLVAMEGPLQLKRSDIAYFQLIQQQQQDSSRRKTTSRPILRVLRESGEHDVVLKDRFDHQFQSQEVCGRAGRCVSLVEVATRHVLLTILPVSLPRYFFREDRVVDDKYFSTWQNALFTPFTTVPPRLTREEAGWGPEYCMTRYAPDEQYDAATHVLFALDSVLTVERKFYPTLSVG